MVEEAPQLGFLNDFGRIPKRIGSRVYEIVKIVTVVGR
jgi:hypothetical protein